MVTLGVLAFAEPLALLGLIALPVVWWLLRAIPPAPRRVPFPPVRFLAELATTEDKAHQSPLWLLLLRLALAAALIIALARPILNAAESLPGQGPVVAIVDNGWAAAHDWPRRQATLSALIDRADRDARKVAIVTTAARAPKDEPPTATPLAAGDARAIAQSLRPRPWTTDRSGAADAVVAQARAAGWSAAAIFWLADGIEEPSGAPTLAQLCERLRLLGTVSVLAPDPRSLTTMLRPPESDGAGLRMVAVRPTGDGEKSQTVRALADDGTPVGAETLHFAPGALKAEASLQLPAELASRLSRIDIPGEETAAVTVLIDDRWHRRPVGLVDSDSDGSERPLIGSRFYLQRAFETFAEVRKGSITTLLSRELAVLVIDDGAPADQGEREQLARWMMSGGTVLRFAGPRLSANPQQGEDLLPVRLRGDRILGGTLSWRRPAKLAPFEPHSPFFGLAVPADVEVRQQLLAEPSLDIDQRTWARLDDGTPLVTGERKGSGWVVLVHTTASPEWSNLVLSGLFVEMLKRTVALSRGVITSVQGGPPLEPLQVLDGFGRLGPPPADVSSIPAAAFAETRVTAGIPPGFYGNAGGRRALNLTSALPDPKPLAAFPPTITRAEFGADREQDLRPHVFALALFLVIADLAASLALRGLLRKPRLARTRQALGSVIAATLLVSGAGAAAQTTVADGTAHPSSLITKLAYIRTGEASIDAVSHAGLQGLSVIINRRTAAEMGPPVAVDPETDELAFYPLLVWPLDGAWALPSPRGAGRLIAYMRNGGTILFDGRRRDRTDMGGRLRDLARILQLPSLHPVPDDHVLTRAYYLLAEFPGRWTGDTVWVERGNDLVLDGVTTVIAGNHDWTGAWAMDEAQRPMFAVVPGGERQRELAYRFGVNVVMHVLTGNYKADQVHLPAILERLGR